MRAYFITQLRTLYESKLSPDPVFALQFSTFLDEVELFIDLLLAMRDLPETVEWKDERTSAIYRLMDFIRRVGRSELYVHFVHQLVGINLEAKDWLGAGLAMKCHAEVYEWAVDGDLVDRWAGEGVKLPAQTQFARRESLYYHAIDYFGKLDSLPIPPRETNTDSGQPKQRRTSSPWNCVKSSPCNTRRSHMMSRRSPSSSRTKRGCGNGWDSLRDPNQSTSAS
jgi:hypothetical protein